MFFSFCLSYDMHKLVSNIYCSSKSNDHDELNIGIHKDDNENPFIIKKEKGSRNNKVSI